MGYSRLVHKRLILEGISMTGGSRRTALSSWSCHCQARAFSLSSRQQKDDTHTYNFQIPNPPSIPGADASSLSAQEPVTSSIPTTVVDATSGFVDTIPVALNAAGEPTLASVGLGSSYWPSGWAQHAFEFLHADFGLPWWAAILAGTLAVRLAIFPLVIGAQKNAAKMSHVMPQFQILQEKVNEAKAYGNQLEALRLTHEMMDYMKKSDTNFLRGLKLPLIQAPIFLSIFLGLKGMAYAPVESLKHGGLWWFTDLTIADPYYALPVLTCATLALVMKVGVDTGSSAMAASPVTQMVVKIMPVVMFPFIMGMPTDLVWYWFCANSISLVQVSFLKIPWVREKFNIPPMKVWTPEEMPSGKKKGFFESFKQSYGNMKAAGDIKARQDADRIRFREAGTGPVPKTFKYDPTKSPPAARKVFGSNSTRT